MAAQIAAKYGALVDITVGLLPYPDRFTGGAARCVLSLAIDPDPALTATVSLDTTSVHAGDSALVLGDGTIEGFVGGQCAEGSVRVAALEASSLRKAAMQ